MKKVTFSAGFFAFMIFMLTSPAARVYAAASDQTAAKATADNFQVGSIQTADDEGQGGGADPFQEMQAMQSRLVQMMKGLMNSDFMGGTSPAGAFSSPSLQPDYDVIETKDAYLVKMDAPGMQKDRIDVQLKNDILTVTAERQQVQQDAEDRGGMHYYYRGRTYGTFQRSLKVPQNVKTDAISAKYEDGVLTMTLPKAAEKTTDIQKIKVA